MYIYIVRTFILWYTMTNRINIDDLKAEYIGKQINWFTIINIYRNDKNIIMFTCKCKCGKEVNITKRDYLQIHQYPVAVLNLPLRAVL